MNRRTLLTAATATVSAVASQWSSHARKRPNVLFVFGDQHRFVSLPGEPFSTVAAQPRQVPPRQSLAPLHFDLSSALLFAPILMIGRYLTKYDVVNNATWMHSSESPSAGPARPRATATATPAKTLSSSPMTIRRFIPPRPKRLESDNWYV